MSQDDHLPNAHRTKNLYNHGWTDDRNRLWISNTNLNTIENTWLFIRYYIIYTKCHCTITSATGIYMADNNELLPYHRETMASTFERTCDASPRNCKPISCFEQIIEIHYL